jgi:hypothetical protein
MNIISRYTLVAVSALLLASACAPTDRDIRVETSGAAEAPAANIHAKTYAIASAEQVPAQYQSPPRSLEAARHMRPLIEEALRAKGYVPAASIAEADLVFMYSAGRRTREMPPAPASHNPDADVSSDNEQEFVEGAITIDALDGKTGARVWHGLGRTQIDSDRVDDALLRKGVTQVLEKFPAVQSQSR